VGRVFDGICGGTVRRVRIGQVGVPFVLRLVRVVCLHLTLPIGLGPLLGRCFHESSSRKLLEFRLNDETGELVDSAVIDGPADKYLRKAVGEALRAGKSPFLSIQTDPGHLVFDMRTRVFYELPVFRVALVRADSYE
jgi:hypothetical protein